MFYAECILLKIGRKLKAFYNPDVTEDLAFWDLANQLSEEMLSCSWP